MFTFILEQIQPGDISALLPLTVLVLDFSLDETGTPSSAGRRDAPIGAAAAWKHLRRLRHLRRRSEAEKKCQNEQIIK